LPRTAIVWCCEHNQFTGKGDSRHLAIARYNQAVLTHIKEENDA